MLLGSRAAGWKLATVLLATAALVAGCGGDDADATSATDESTTTTDEATATTDSGATIQQYASIVAEHRGELLANISEAEACTLGPDFPCPTGPALSVFSVGLEGKTLALALGNAASASSNVHIGPPPAEIEDLVARTVDAAEQVDVAANAWSDGNCGAQPNASVTAGPDCEDLSFELGMAFDDVADVLAAWDPYI